MGLILMPPLHLFRFRANEDLEMSALSMYGGPDHLRGFVGRGRVEATGELLSSIVFERPTEWNELAHASKEQLEETQVRRFLRDYARAAIEPLAASYARGDDPPDFVLTRSDGGKVGLECTQLVIADRIHAWNSAESLNRSLLALRRDRFRHLRSHTVYLTIDTPNGLPPPGARGKREVAQALQAFQPAPNDFTSPPEDLSGSNIVQTFGNYVLTAVPQADFRVSPFVRQMGFDLALAIQSDVYASAAWAALAERVREKDLRGSDAILVSCGAPVTRGLSFPSDDLAAEAIMASASTHALPPTVNATAAYVHAWGNEQIVRLSPGAFGVQPLTLR